MRAKIEDVTPFAMVRGVGGMATEFYKYQSGETCWIGFLVSNFELDRYVICNTYIHTQNIYLYISTTCYMLIVLICLLIYIYIKRLYA